MGKQSMEIALKAFDERYYKHRIEREKLDIFGKNILEYLKQINEAMQSNETEGHIKGIINKFLKHSFYSNDNYDINTYKRADSAIKYKGILHAIIEVKKPKNRIEMVTQDNLNRKALWEIVLYYLMETRLTGGSKVKNNPNSEIRRVIITDSREWILINAQDLDKICDGYLEQQFYKYQNGLLSYANDTDKFYATISEYFTQIDVTNKLNYVYFRIDKEYKYRRQWQYMYKILHPAFLIKYGYKQLGETHILNSKFYKELLYIMGLKEEKIKGKNQIIFDKNIKNSLIGQTITILQDDKGYSEKKASDDAFQLVIIWVNRLLFIKLFEGQLLAFNGDEPCYHILDNEKITSFQEMQDLFFDVFGKKERMDNEFINQFAKIPYLNSSLFERYEIEKEDINIRAIENLNVIVKRGSVLGKTITEMPILEYIINFLNAYSFSARIDKDGAIQKKNEIIDASVLGLIFEKINGYREGSFYTKGFVTEYICKETLEKTIVEKINDEYGWHAKSINDLKLSIDISSANQIKKINEIINSIRVCDPSVGSGHFLVSALNRIIVIKKELGVLMKADNSGRFTEYDIAVIDDILCVFDGQGNEFHYKKNDALSQIIQKTLFNEKRTIIENCLFGVDINSNAVAICQLRLWIELLKNAYYEYGVMETLPNIDINIKCGNSLIHKMQYEVGKKLGVNNAILSNEELKQLKNYKNAVKRYKITSDKNEKHKVKQAIDAIRNNLHSVYDQMTFVANADVIDTYSSQADEDRMFDIYKNGFEWAIEFPEILDEDGTFLGFDCIIGNPPYIRVQELDHRDIDFYKRTYSTAWKRLDISTLFIELANGLITKNGRISFVTSNQFVSTEYGRMIRKHIVDRQLIEKIVDFGDLPVFDSALTYVSIFFMHNHVSDANCLKYYKVPKLPFITPLNEQFIDVGYSGLSEEAWEMEGKEEKECLEKIRKASVDVLRGYAKCWAGAYTGCDEVLLFDIGDKNVPIEDELMISVIRAEGCSRYGNATPTKKMFYPYKEVDNETQLVSLDEIKTYYPQAYEYITKHQERLKSRKDSRKTFGDRTGWYGLARFGKLSRYKQTKIVSPGEVKHNKFCIDKTGSSFSCARVFSINLESEDIDINYLLAILNSKVSEFYLHKTTSLKQGGYYSYSSTALDALPIAIDGNKEKIIGLAQQIDEIKSKNEDSSELERELDNIIFHLYGLNERDIQVIETALAE